MTSYSWLQMIRVLAGKDPGHPDFPDTEPALDIQPKAVCDVLVAGCAEVTGLPIRGGRRETIPPLQWNDIHIELSAKSLFTDGRDGFGIVARLTDDDGWYDLDIGDKELAKLKSISSRLVSPLLPSDEVMTIEDASLFMAVRLGNEPWRQRIWLVSQFDDGKIKRYYASPITNWAGQPLPLGPCHGSTPIQPVPHPKHWRVRRSQVLEAISDSLSLVIGQTCVPPGSEWPWISYELAEAIVRRVGGYTPNDARLWLVARSVGGSTQHDRPTLRTRFEPRAQAALEKKSIRESFRIESPTKIFDDFGEDTSALGNRPGCCAWYPPIQVLLREMHVNNGLSFDLVEWHDGELRAALGLEFAGRSELLGQQLGVEPLKSLPRTSASKRLSDAVFKRWYQEFVSARAQAPSVSQMEERAAVKAAFPDNHVTRDRLRSARREFAPDSWRARGRRESAGKLAEN